MRGKWGTVICVHEEKSLRNGNMSESEVPVLGFSTAEECRGLKNLEDFAVLKIGHIETKMIRRMAYQSD